MLAKGFKFLKALVLFLPLTLLCSIASASIFEVLPTDQSVIYLGQIFGGSVGPISLGGTTNNNLLSKIFETYNYIILTFGAVSLGYLAVVGMINTVREGSPLGSKMNLWIPLRSFLGLLLMVPTGGSGYSVIQATTMWVILSGVGAASSLWGVVIGQLEAGVAAGSSLSLQIQPSNLNNLTQQVMRASVCMNTINNMTELAKIPGPYQSYGPVRLNVIFNDVKQNPNALAPTQISQTSILKVGMQNAPAPYDTLCGYFITTSTLNSGDSLNAFNLPTLTRRLQIKTAALQAMFTAVDSATQLLANPNLSQTDIVNFDRGYVYASGSAYISQITNLATGVELDPSGAAWEQPAKKINLSDDLRAMKSYGWISAGSYYYTMVKASGAKLDPETVYGKAVLPTADLVPIVTQLDGNTGEPQNPAGWGTNTGSSYNTGIPALLDGTGPFFETRSLNKVLTNTDYFYGLDATTPAPPTRGIATTSSPGTGSQFLDLIVNAISSGVRDPILAYMQNLVSGNGQDPLLNLAQFGTNLMLASEISLFAAIVISFGVSLGVSAVSCMNPLPWAVNLLFTQVMPLIYGASILLWGAGATLGIYTPLVPYIVFTTSAFGFFIQVIESIVGAPIIALGLTSHSEGELGKATEGIIILANLFLRPILMIIGFTFAASLVKAGLMMVNFGFISALAQATNSTMFSIIAVLCLYVFLVLAIVNKSFSLVYELPNKIMRWIGGRSEESNPSDMIGEAKKGFDSGASNSGVGGGMAAAKEITGEAIDKHNKKVDKQAEGKPKGELPNPAAPGGGPGAPGGGPGAPGGGPGAPGGGPGAPGGAGGAPPVPPA